MSQPLVDRINKFGFALQSLTLQPDKPCGMCALNIYQCLMMLATGTTGDVLAGFQRALGFQDGHLDVSSQNSSSLDKYYQSSPSVELISVSSLWYQEDFLIRQSWRENLKQVFDATVQPIQLTAINAFIEKGTKGKFKDLVSANDVGGCLLMLITCLYFKAEWADPFSIHATVAKTPFYPLTDKPETCHMMHKTARLQYIEDTKTQVCILPYKAVGSNSTGPCWKAAIILPKDRGYAAIGDILSRFSKDSSSLHSILNCTNAGRPIPKVNLRLPRFTLKMHLDLQDALSTLGLGPAFSPSRDFAPISDTSPLMISRVTQDLLIEVNERGTEMAAVAIVALRKFVFLAL